MVEELIVSNGLAWSADGATMYHSDSKVPVIWAYDYDTRRRDLGSPGRRPTDRRGRAT